jgi:hypothetical protein
MTPLQDAQRRQGGNTRAGNQSRSDRAFLAKLAASRRPLLHDAKFTDDDDLLRTFHAFAESPGPNGRPWLTMLIVGADGRTIRIQLGDGEIRKRLKLVGGAIGFMGVTTFGSPDPNKGRNPSIQVYYKPLKKGNGVVETLKKVSGDVVRSLLGRLRPVEWLDTEVGN